MKHIEPSRLLDIHPKEWLDTLPAAHTSVYQYRNLLHFKSHVKTLTQKENLKCGISYSKALEELLKEVPTMSEGDYQIIKHKVKENLLKRGLISESVYESYKYDIEGQIWDVAKVIAEDPACFLVPNETYKNYFYELYISISYPYHVTNETVLENMAKILATIELLEREHIYCKISLVLPIKDCSTQGKPNFLAILPLFSHRDEKSITTMSAVLNDRLLRKFFFAILESEYGSHLAPIYGTAVDLPYTIKPVDLDEVELCQSILNQIIIPGERR